MTLPKYSIVIVFDYRTKNNIYGASLSIENIDQSFINITWENLTVKESFNCFSFGINNKSNWNLCSYYFNYSCKILHDCVSCVVKNLTKIQVYNKHWPKSSTKCQQNVLCHKFKATTMNNTRFKVRCYMQILSKMDYFLHWQCYCFRKNTDRIKYIIFLRINFNYFSWIWISAYYFKRTTKGVFSIKIQMGINGSTFGTAVKTDKGNLPLVLKKATAFQILISLLCPCNNTNSMAYETQRFNATFTRALQ